jgi:hypothetical protein
MVEMDFTMMFFQIMDYMCCRDKKLIFIYSLLGFQIMDSENMNDVLAQPLSQAVVFSFLIYQVAPLIQADEDGIILVFFGCINYTIHGTQRCFRILEADIPTSLRCYSSSSRIYIETVIVVVISYILGAIWYCFTSLNSAQLHQLHHRASQPQGR